MSNILSMPPEWVATLYGEPVFREDGGRISLHQVDDELIVRGMKAGMTTEIPYRAELVESIGAGDFNDGARRIGRMTFDHGVVFAHLQLKRCVG